MIYSLLAMTGAAAPPVMEKVMPFAGGNQVRIEVAVKAGDASGELEIKAAIREAGAKRLLWEGRLGGAAIEAGHASHLSYVVRDLKPNLWEPSSPALYDLEVTAAQAGKTAASQSTRFGFRSFESRHGQFYLNGGPIFLRGLAINPPGRGIPAETGESRVFAEAYVRFLRSQNVNTIRLTHDSQVWFDVCDELGMIVYQGQYGSPPGGRQGKQGAPEDFSESVSAYQTLFEAYARHPSILIYILSNELPVSGPRGKAYHDFLSRASTELKAWDPTRLIIGNAGYGEGREGDICDVHRYWGWYYNTFLTYYNLRDPKMFGDPEKDQPITFSECVGSFTGPSGEFNIVARKQLGAQLNWTGHSADQRGDALRYQAFIVQQATETFRRLRPLNPRLAGLMPFTILFYNWSGVTSFDQMKAKPAMDQLSRSYQPVLLSWELWTPQVYAGAQIHPIVHVINDAEDGQGLTNALVNFQIEASDGRVVVKDEKRLADIPYYGTGRERLNIKLPATLATGDYRLVGTVMSQGRVVSRNEAALFVAGNEWTEEDAARQQTVLLYDTPSSPTRAALRRLGVRVESLAKGAKPGPRNELLVIGEEAWGTTGSPLAAHELKEFVEAGGRVLCLRQEPAKFDVTWLPEPISFFTASANAPTYPPASRPFRGNMNVNPERPEHPIFKGLTRNRLALWSDYSGWDQTRPGFPLLYPVTAGFKLQKADSLARTAVLADYDRGLEGIALCEMFAGKGSVILCGFDLVARAGLDPAADRLLANLVRYAASHEDHSVHPLISTPILWGNYASERGLIAGPLNGLVVNADWVAPATDPSAKPLTQAEGAWNTLPGDEFLPHGRSPLGPFGYSTGSSLKDLNPESKIGSGIFWAQIPAGKSHVTTSVKNPGKQAAELTVTVNGSSSSGKILIPAGKTMPVTVAIPDGTTEISVRFDGTKTIVLLETRIE